MFTPRVLSRVVCSSVSSSSSVLAFTPDAAAVAVSVSVGIAPASCASLSGTGTGGGNCHRRWLCSSLLSCSTFSSSSSLLLSRRGFSGSSSSSSPVVASPSSGSDVSSNSLNAPVTNSDIQTLLNRAETLMESKALNAPSQSGGSAIPARLTASQYAEHLKQLAEIKPNMSNIQKALNYLTPNRADPTVNNAILELYSEAFESNWTEEQRRQVAAYLEQEFQKGGDAALVVAINKLLEKRVTIRGIIDSLGGWYPLAGLATVIAISKELIIVNEELLMVTNFLTVFIGLYLVLADTVVEGHRATKDALAKKFYEHRQLSIDVNKALLAAYEKNPKVVTLLEELKADINRLITERSRAIYLKKRAEIQRRFLKELDGLIAAEAQAEGNVRRQILDRFSDYIEFQIAIKRLNPQTFFQDGMLSALTELLTGQPIKAVNTPIGQLVKSYIEGALWKVDWKHLKLGTWGLKYFGIDASIKWIKAVDAIKKAQIADVEKFKKENPKATAQDYYKARGVEGEETLGAFLRRQFKNNPQQLKDTLERSKKEQAAWEVELKRVMAEVKQEQEQKSKPEGKATTKIDVEKLNKELRAKLAAAAEKGKKLDAQAIAARAH